MGTLSVWKQWSMGKTLYKHLSCFCLESQWGEFMFGFSDEQLVPRVVICRLLLCDFILHHYGKQYPFPGMCLHKDRNFHNCSKCPLLVSWTFGGFGKIAMLIGTLQNNFEVYMHFLFLLRDTLLCLLNFQQWDC